MPDLSLSDISLHYEISGDGAPLLLLAGMLSDNATWAPLLPVLEPHFTIIRPDNRTTGRTTPWNAPVSVSQVVDDAIALMDHLGHHQFDIAGHSMGGLMGLEIAGLLKDRVSSLTILASGAVRIPRSMAMFDSLLEIRRSRPDGEALWLKALYPWVFRPAFFDDPANTQMALDAALAYPFGQTADAMALQIEALRDYRPRTKPNDATCSVQALHAADDILIPIEPAQKSFAAITGIRQHVIADSGHSIVWDQPAAVADHILSIAGQA
jgi:pimeloyl-ACP methyl ester carboxylesterase